MRNFVIPAKAGIRQIIPFLDPRFGENDGFGDFSLAETLNLKDLSSIIGILYPFVKKTAGSCPEPAGG